MEQTLKNFRRRKEFMKGDLIFQEKNPAEGIFIVESGTIKLFKIDHSGKEVILRLVTKGAILGQHCLTSIKEYPYSARAVEHTVGYLAYPHELTQIDKHKLFSFLLEKTDTELIHSQGQCVELMKKSVRERLAGHFAYMGKYHGEARPEGVRITVRLSREEIASMIGTAHETAIRFIGEFKDTGILKEENRYFTITNPDALLRIAEPEKRSLL